MQIAQKKKTARFGRRFCYDREVQGVDIKEKAGAGGIFFGRLIGAAIKMAFYITVTLAMLKYLRG